MKQLLKRDFLPLDHEHMLFQQHQTYHQDVRSFYEQPVDFMRLAERVDLQEMVSKSSLKIEVHLQSYNTRLLQDEEELAKQHEPVQDILNMESEVIGHPNKEEPIVISESKEVSKESKGEQVLTVEGTHKLVKHPL